MKPIAKHHIQVQKTARYFTYGELSERTKRVWFICHGYGQLAKSFLKRFTDLNPQENYIVAPEGLHRFYWEGFSDKVVASWMTKEDREEDIHDYVRYLDQVFETAIPVRHNFKVLALGFSQGTATISRWFNHSSHEVDVLVLYAGAIAADMDWQFAQSKFKKTQNILVYGDDDKWIKPENVESQRQVLQKENIPFKEINFKGKHEVLPETLNAIIKAIK